MVQRKHDEVDAAVSEKDPGTTSARVRLAEERSSGHCRTGQRAKLSEIATKYRLNEDAVSGIFSELQALGMDKVSGNGPAILYAPSAKEMQQAYEIRAALEEIGGRAAARTLQGNTAGLRRELDAMREAFRLLDLDSFLNHDVAFHRTILQASKNEVLLRLWDSLALDLRIRRAIDQVARNLDLHDVVESPDNSRGS
jgi:DNA-binding GntR family transcriptional regulator